MELPQAFFVLGRQIAGATFLFPNLGGEKQPILAALAAYFGDGGLAVALQGDHVALGEGGVIFQAGQVVQAGSAGGDQLHGLGAGEAEGLAQNRVKAEALHREFDLAPLPLRGGDVCKRDDRGLDADEVRTFEDLCPPAELESFYQKHQNSKCTIYIGDMFYYHVTNSKELPLIAGKESFSYKKYCDEMLALHIKELERHNKKVRFVYINNAQVSHWLTNGMHKTFDTLPGTAIKVFYGGMLSGMRSMDMFSLERLVQEVRREI